MAFVHEHEIVPLERIHRHRFLAGRFPQFVNVDDIHSTASEECRAVLVVILGLDAGQFKLFFVLTRQAFVWRQQHDAV